MLDARPGTLRWFRPGRRSPGRRPRRHTRLRAVFAAPVSWWFRSLPLRVIASTLVASVLVLALGGWLLLTQATNGVLAAKRESAVAEAVAAFDTAQSRLYAAGYTRANVNSVLAQLAIDAASRGTATGQYAVVVEGPAALFTSGNVRSSSIPQSLRDTVTHQGGGGLAPDLRLWVTPTLIVYNDGRTEPGLVVGEALVAPGSGRYPMYLVFPLGDEVRVLQVVQNAVISTGALLAVLLTGIAAMIARQVVSPVRAAREAAERLAAGLLDDRMTVRGSDDLARLAISMNHMASELQKQISQLEELSRVQQRFVSDVSHELRTPLTTVQMAAGMLYAAREDFDPVTARSAELLQAELDRFEALLTDLLEISRFDAGAAELSVEEIDLVALARRVVAANASLARKYGTPITVRSDGPVPCEIDPRRVERIVRNLVSNAIEHGEGRPIVITVAGDEEAVALTVRDHGVGFDAAQARQVFHRFWRADPARSRTVGGTGLGLAIAMEDARLHGGWLNAWGRPRQGAQFRLTVPRRRGGILQSSPLPVVPRDLVVAAHRTAGAELRQPLATDAGVGARRTGAATLRAGAPDGEHDGAIDGAHDGTLDGTAVPQDEP